MVAVLFVELFVELLVGLFLVCSVEPDEEVPLTGDEALCSSTAWEGSVEAWA